MLNLALNGGILSGIWDAIKSVVQFFSSFIDILKGLFQALTVYIFSVFYYLHMGICSIVNFSEMLFKKFAGLDPIMSADGPVNILDVFVKSNEIWGLFIAILVLSIVLLLLFTLVAIIKSEFALDVKGSAKGPIVARSLKSLAMFIIVPVVSLMGIYAVNAITNTINDMMKGGSNTSMVNQIFYTMSYNANKARINKEFADHIRGFSDRKGGSYRNDNAGYFKGSQDDIAYQIDMAFKGNEGHRASGYKALNIFDDMIPAEDFSTLLMPVSMANLVDTYSVWDIVQVNYYFSLMEIDYIIGLGSAIVISYLLLSMCVVLVKRIFEIVILLLLAAPMIALAPLDGGSASKSWQKEFIKRVISIVAPVFAINMYFIMIPLFMNITIFGGGINSLAQVGAISLSNTGSLMAIYATYDAIFQLLAICVGMSVVKTASALLCNLLGIEDLVKSGQEATKKAVGTAVQVAAMASGVGGGVMALAKGGMSAIGGMAKGMKAGKGFGGSLKSGFSQAREAWAEGKDERTKAFGLLKDKTIKSDLVKNSAFGQLLDKDTYKNMGRTNAEIDAEKRRKEKEKDLRASEAAAETLDREDGVKGADGKRTGGTKAKAAEQAALKKGASERIKTEYNEEIAELNEEYKGKKGKLKTAKKKQSDISERLTDVYEARTISEKAVGDRSIQESERLAEVLKKYGLKEGDLASTQTYLEGQQGLANGAVEELERQLRELGATINETIASRDNARRTVRDEHTTVQETATGFEVSSTRPTTQHTAGDMVKAGAQGLAQASVIASMHVDAPEVSVGQMIADNMAAGRTASGVDAANKVGSGAGPATARALETLSETEKGLNEVSADGVVKEYAKTHDGANDQQADAVEKGVKEASHDLAEAIKSALQSGKLSVDGIAQLRNAMEGFNKAFLSFQKNDTSGKELLEAIEALKKTVASAK